MGLNCKSRLTIMLLIYVKTPEKNQSSCGDFYEFYSWRFWEILKKHNQTT